MIRKIFLWIGLSYSFMSNAQLVLKSGVAASSTTNSNSIYTNGKFKIGGLTNGTAPTTDPTASLEVNGDATFNLSSAQAFKINLSGAPNNKLQFDNTDLGFRLNSYTSASTANWCYIGSSFNYTSVAASVVRSLSFNDINTSWGISGNHSSFRINNSNTTGTLGLSTGGIDRFVVKPNGDIETASEYQKLLIGAVSAANPQPGYITGDDLNNKKLMLYHPMAVRLSNSPVTNPATNVSDGLYVSNGNKIGINAFPVDRVHANVIGSCARFDCAVANSTTLSPEENRERVYIGRDNKMAISFIPMSSNNSWIHMHHTLNDGLQISTGPYVGTNPLVTFRGNGQVLIGNKIPASNSYNDANAKLIVDGKIMAKEIVANFNDGEWRSFPDYVFEKDYKLMPLDSLRGYIATNKHLPEIPSAKEVEANGLHLSSLAVQQMKKIEELTLYLLEQQKQMQTQQEQLGKQQQQISDLQKEVAGLKSKE